MHNRNYKRNNKRKLLDETFNLEKSYFFQELKDSELDSIKAFIDSYFSKGIKDVEELEKFFTHYPVLTKGDQNIKKLRKALEEIATQHKDQESFFDSYSSINNFIIDEYMTTKPTVLEVLFFPSETNEDKVANMIRTSKKSLNIAIFTLTNDRLTAAVEEVYQRGVEVRIITDDECCKNLGSDIFRLALLVIISIII